MAPRELSLGFRQGVGSQSHLPSHSEALPLPAVTSEAALADGRR
jgi:hypothetical protein